ncbi:Glutamine--fructose-6-phosphate aminotransferase [isomerizing] 2 [Thelohanellus kitauei]|uniref:glutamine--fructose-6-phosphate transaminase (isomerizing) n=1 Tax=Thelohanellus kitauei TaxID=669202 RepID=A0A0C2I656_THEKT|nr:Glutamine--fructose-6-phosphate aminotransferase [isomerizing] 2 [Thelohanellus kitauei]
MVGIFGYVNHKNARARQEIIDTLLEGLSKQEYHGYDSVGIAIDFIHKRGGEDTLTVIKDAGSLAKFRKTVQEQKALDIGRIFSSHFGMGHLRWASHGEPKYANCHPQTSDYTDEFLLMHNGMITNYRDIKNMLNSHDITQVSETDTELVVQLMKFFYDNHKSEAKEGEKAKKRNFIELAMMVQPAIEGASAFLFKSRYFRNEVLAMRMGSPLMIGIKKNSKKCRYDVPIIYDYKLYNKLCETSDMHKIVPEYEFNSNRGAEYYISSDASSIIDHTKQIIYLEDGDIAHIKDGHLYIHRYHKYQIDRVLLQEAQTVHMKLHEIMKGSYDSFVEKDIFEQPESVLNTMRGRINYSNKTIRLGGVENHKYINRCRRIIFIACGSSYNSCIAARQQLEILSELPIMIEHGSDMLEREMPVFRDDCCVFVSRSGQTEDTVNALRYCKKPGALLMGITNSVGSIIARETECGIHLNAKNEFGISTKTYSSQVVALILFACVLGEEKLPKIKKIGEIIDGTIGLVDAIKDCLKLAPRINEIAKKYVGIHSCFVVGSGVHTATCLEGALKIKTLSLIHSEGIQAGDLKYTHLDLVDENVLVIIVITDCRSFPKTVDAFHQVLRKKAKPLIITDCKSKLANVDSFDVLEIPHIIDCLQPISAIIPLQLLALYLAKHRGVPMGFDMRQTGGPFIELEDEP